jgi:hypothetical protein
VRTRQPHACNFCTVPVQRFPRRSALIDRVEGCSPLASRLGGRGARVRVTVVFVLVAGAQAVAAAYIADVCTVSAVLLPLTRGSAASPLLRLDVWVGECAFP